MLKKIITVVVLCLALSLFANCMADVDEKIATLSGYIELLKEWTWKDDSENEYVFSWDNMCIGEDGKVYYIDNDSYSEVLITTAFGHIFLRHFDLNQQSSSIIKLQISIEKKN